MMKGQSCFAYAGPALTQRLTSTPGVRIRDRLYFLLQV
jgi:hypothetical protein